MIDTLIKVAILLSGGVSAIFLLGFMVYYLKKLIKYLVKSKPDRDLKKIEKIKKKYNKELK